MDNQFQKTFSKAVYADKMWNWENNIRKVELRLYVHSFPYSLEEALFYERFFFKVEIVIIKEIKIHYKRCHVNKNK